MMKPSASKFRSLLLAFISHQTIKLLYGDGDGVEEVQRTEKQQQNNKRTDDDVWYAYDAARAWNHTKKAESLAFQKQKEHKSMQGRKRRTAYLGVFGFINIHSPEGMLLCV